MILNVLKPRKALNKAFLKVKANRSDIELFKTNLISLLNNINECESEEFHKNLVSKFLTDTRYGANHFINTKGRNDLVIHNTSSASGTVGVIIEAKKPANKAEMPSLHPSGGVGGGLNSKAFQELVLYYLRERITHKNLELKYLIATNIYEWFIFDANLFEKEFAQNKTLVKQFTDFEEGRLSGKTTDFFYKQIAEPAINDIKHEITFTHFDIRDYDKPLRNADKKDDNILIALQKLLSPEHLLKLPFANDSNSLDKSFYTELLHIIGLTEIKEGSKKLIQRKKEGERNPASLIESAIFQLDNLDKISRLPKPSRFGDTNAERLFNIALELSITWINRILFLKLLEAQLIKYHKGDKSFAFLNSAKVQNFDDLNNLFFSVLARKPIDRNAEVKATFANVPYLNSSLFEPTEIEHACLFISQLKDVKLPLLPSTVIKDNGGEKRTGQLLTIEYIFEFLNAYDFASEGSEEIQEDNKRLINASVLGLIFEKINGYKDGSFFTPGFITMYMCRETIRRAVVQKFNETKNWNCTSINDLYDKIDDRPEANNIINSLKICDPAVGSGHFLVSALNEIIAIKSDLRILTDRTGKRLKEYVVEVENDELIVTDDDGELFTYNPTSKESQRIQETLFHEKQTIIENCLFGVDLNPNSVKICRLRLWIELLKNAYYKVSPVGGDLEGGYELETLPNIDINIKCGNSLISRYALDADIKKALKRSKWTIDSYRMAVMTYRNAQSKDEKHAMERLINEIKNDFESEIAANDKRLIKLNKTRGELFALTTQTTMFERTKAEKANWEKQVKTLTDTVTALETEIEEIRSNRIYENAFEWRFEFPEVLNNEGDYIGFDVVIGNPPYGVDISEINKQFGNRTINTKTDSYQIFYVKSYQLAKVTGLISLIIPNSWMSRKTGIDFRNSILEKEILISINFIGSVFDDANIDTCIILIRNTINEKNTIVNAIQLELPNTILGNLNFNKIEIEQWKSLGKISCSMNLIEYKIINKLLFKSLKLGDVCSIIGGYKPYQVGYGKSVYGNYPQTNDDVLNRVYHSDIKISDEFYPDIKGSNIHKYYIKQNTQWVKWGNWLMSPKNKELFTNDKIVVREIIGNGLIAAWDDNGYFTNDTTHIITHSSKEYLLFILGLLNSKLLGYFFKKFYGEENELFPKVKINELKNLPVIENPEIQNNISYSVLQIIKLKKDDILTCIKDLESQIDQVVYQLYELTDEEIEIVEENFRKLVKNSK
jgi:hypothetical protein